MNFGGGGIFTLEIDSPGPRPSTSRSLAPDPVEYLQVGSQRIWRREEGKNVKQSQHFLILCICSLGFWFAPLREEEGSMWGSDISANENLKIMAYN